MDTNGTGSNKVANLVAVISDDGGSAALLAALKEQEGRGRTLEVELSVAEAPAPRPMPNLPEL